MSDEPHIFVFSTKVNQSRMMPLQYSNTAYYQAPSQTSVRNIPEVSDSSWQEIERRFEEFRSDLPPTPITLPSASAKKRSTEPVKLQSSDSGSGDDEDDSDFIDKEFNSKYHKKGPKKTSKVARATRTSKAVKTATKLLEEIKNHVDINPEITDKELSSTYLSRMTIGQLGQLMDACDGLSKNSATMNVRKNVQWNKANDIIKGNKCSEYADIYSKVQTANIDQLDELKKQVANAISVKQREIDMLKDMSFVIDVYTEQNTKKTETMDYCKLKELLRLEINSKP